MKKFFLIGGLAAFSFAAAQQNDFFDIQKHLQQKQAEERLQKLKDRFIPPNTQSPTIKLLGNRPQAKLSHTLPNGTKVYSLPLDNMPCLVPDKNLYADNMLQSPAKFELSEIQHWNNRRLPGAIPNPVFPWKIIPDEGK